MAQESRIAVNPFTGKELNWDDTPFNSPDVDLNMQDLHDWYADTEKREADLKESIKWMSRIEQNGGVTEEDLPF